MFEKALAAQSVRDLKDSELDQVGGGFDPFAFTQSEVEIPGGWGDPMREVTMLTTDDYDETIPG